MAKYFYTIILIIISLLNVELSSAQINCSNYLDKHCDTYGSPFKYSGQSKSAMFEKGHKSIYKITIYEGFEYRVAICADKLLKGTYFRIREDDVNKSIIYDSSTEEEDFLEKFFYSDESKNLYIEVIVPEGDEAPEEENYDKRFGCVALVLEYYRRKDMGFE